MKPVDLPPLETLRELLICDERTGRLFWKPRDIKWFQVPGKNNPARDCNRWNRQRAGKEALTSQATSGYKRGTILGTYYLAHRVVYYMATGETPKFIDHINHDRLDNRPANLRSVEFADNVRNRTKPRNNSSGLTGVQVRPSGRWAAFGCVGGKRTTIGTFDSKELALEARSAVLRANGFHPNHGT